MTKILILEDDKKCLLAITKMVERVSEKVSAVPVSSLDEARAVLNDVDSPFQAFFLDINLNINDDNNQSGIEFAKEIRTKKEYAFTPIVMITSIANMELRAYRELHCYQYLVKPYNEEDIKQLVSKLLFMSQSGETIDSYVLIKKSGVNYKIFCKDIFCIKAITRGVCFVLENEEINVPYTSIKQLLEKLPKEKFLQIHRMCIINQDHIDYLDMVNSLICMKNGSKAEIGVTYKKEVRSRLNG